MVGQKVRHKFLPIPALPNIDRFSKFFTGTFCGVTKFSIECAGEKKLKIGQYLAKKWTKTCGLLFWPTR